MAVNLINEVTAYLACPACADATPAERLVLLLIADRANKITREAWSGGKDGWDLAVSAGLSAVGLRNALQRLAARGLECRKPIGVYKQGKRAGEPMYAMRGTQTTYRLPALPGQKADATASALPAESRRHSIGIGASDSPSDSPSDSQSRAEKADAVAPRGDATAPRGDAVASPYPSKDPSKNPSSARARARVPIDLLTDDEEIPNLVLDLIVAERKPRDLAAYVAKIDADGGLPEWIDRANAHRDELAEQAQRDARAAHREAMTAQPECEHGVLGGHVPDATGWWVACPIERKRRELTNQWMTA